MFFLLNAPEQKNNIKQHNNNNNNSSHTHWSSLVPVLACSKPARCETWSTQGLDDSTTSVGAPGPPPEVKVGWGGC